jgi:hypothetical protein
MSDMSPPKWELLDELPRTWWLLTYLIDVIPLPEPFHRVARIAILVIGVLIVILLLLQFIGVVDGGMPRLTR